ncbi:hypothetical protein A3F08_00045 [Candidatus Berkelbacteria bacterium RIFCSPHIGHO2_12_FULL_36_9]|uniref:Uncharacterized protein n=1 Tax=Candidatus Berkelbacteria bacterium RIFCSPHIGHO2_12_FULL_36_9 TaxID=1797469 RepID=A0A1F5EEK2_9BACT|nr:MAG: hypothetical protein A3F08_00045 [Candidatus Berkelbacteria bacterium RIFCSPHIGHO2_12_FULL_36_9]
MKTKYKLHKAIINNHQYSEAQHKQDEIFRKMSADQKLKVASGLWRLAKELAGDKIHYGKQRSQRSFN